MSTVVEEPKGGVAAEATVAEEAPRAPGRPAPAPPPPPTEEAPRRILRPAVASSLMALGTGFLIGGMFTGFSARIFAGVGGLVGVGLAVWASRPSKRPSLVQTLSILGIAIVGILALLDPGSISTLPKLIGEAVKDARVRQPPVKFFEGWRPLVVWTMGAIGYASAWVGIEFRRPATGILIPIPVIAFAAIAQPPYAEVAGGIVAVVLFIISLAVIFRPDYGESEEGRVPTAFEMRRALRTAPFVAAITVGLIFLGRLGFLFPEPFLDPADKARKPRSIPPIEVKDRPLFTVRSTLTGPWRTGILDVYLDNAWNIPPFSGSEFIPVGLDGLLNSRFSAGVAAHFKILGLEGTVLPTPPRARQIVGRLPQLVTDERTGTVRLDSGQVRRNLEYDVSFPRLPRAVELRRAPPPGREMNEFLEAPEPPPRVAQLIAQAQSRSRNLWDQLEFVRERWVDVVEAAGPGKAVDVPPQRVEEVLFSSDHEASPFEFVAAQGLLARWVGVPARIAYGFDIGEKKGANTFEFRPKHSSLWLEVHFEGHSWVPVTGLPSKAKHNIDTPNDPLRQNLIPTDDISVPIYVPLKINPSNIVLRRIQLVILLALPFVALGLLAWLIWPAVVKARLRARRREWALLWGPRARIAVAYSEFRDLSTDLGVGDPHATPLAYLDHVVPDEEHTELAWLVTRALWGDLSERLTLEEVYAAEELSRALRRRIFEAQPFTIRAISIFSRLSLRQPYAPPVPRHRELRRKEVVAHAPS